MALRIPSCPPLLFVFAQNVQDFALAEWQIVRIAANEIEFGQHFLHLSLHWTDQHRRIQIVDFIKLQQLGQIGERVIADAEHRLQCWRVLLHFVDDIVTHFRIFFDTKHIVAGYCIAVAYQEHPVVTLLYQHLVGVLARHCTKIPAIAIVCIERMDCHLLIGSRLIDCSEETYATNIGTGISTMVTIF